MAQRIKDLVLSLQWLRLLLWSGFNPWHRNFCMPTVGPKIKISAVILNAFFLFLFLLVLAMPMTCGNSQARDRN